MQDNNTARQHNKSNNPQMWRHNNVTINECEDTKDPKDPLDLTKSNEIQLDPIRSN